MEESQPLTLQNPTQTTNFVQSFEVQIPSLSFRSCQRVKKPQDTVFFNGEKNSRVS